MHFRHVLITGLLVGAALLLPDQTFAEKNNPNGQQKPGQASEIVKMNIPAKVEKASSEKTVAVSERDLPNKGQIKQQTAKSTPQQATVKKQTAISAKLPKQANGNGPSHVKKTKKAVKTKQAPIVREKTKGLENNEQPAEKMAFESLDPAALVIKEEPAIAIKLEPKEEGSLLPVAKPEEKSIPKSGKKKSPTNKEPIPAVNQGTTPTQRTGNSTVPSNDRLSIGQNTIGSIDKWFEWNKHYKIKHVQPFYSRYVLMSNQWVNAPPSPPPKEAPFLKA